MIIEKYVNDPSKALEDVFTVDSLEALIDDGDIEYQLVDYGDGMQAQVRVLASGSARKFIDRFIAKCAEAGSDVKNMICAEEEFDLCSKLRNSSPGQVMVALKEFLEKKVVAGALIIADFATVGMVSLVLSIFTALGFVNHAFVGLCNCQLDA